MIPPIVEKTLNAPLHFAKGVANLAATPLRAVTGTEYLPNHDDASKSDAPTVYEIADPMMDLTTIIYYYTELRSATNKRLEKFAKKHNMEMGPFCKGKNSLEVLRNAIELLTKRTEALSSLKGIEETTVLIKLKEYKEYKDSLKEIENLKTLHKLTDGDIAVFKTYFEILERPKDAVKIKSDFHLYSQYIDPLFTVSFGGKDFNKQIIEDMVERDEDMYIDYIDDDSVSTSFDPKGFINGFSSEIVYAIVVSKKAKRITVVFRGSVNASDWITNIQVNMTDFDLPGFTTEKAKNDDKRNFGRVHEGFYKYLFGKTQRGSDGSAKSKGEEIMGKLTSLMAEHEGFSLFVTGHSLGASLSTMFAFRAAAMGELPMVTNVTFASPYVGDQTFRDNFYDLEQKKRIRHLRISNDEDVIPLIPCLTLPSGLPIPQLEAYKHTGMNIRLYNEDNIFMPKCRLFYPKKGDTVNEVRNAVLNNVAMGLSVGVISKHLCPEYVKRLQDAEEDLGKITLEGLYSDPQITGWSYADSEPETNPRK